MEDNKVTALFELYLFGRKIKSRIKKRNADKMLLATILRFLKQKACTVGELAKNLHTTLSTISEKIMHLEEQGLVSKSATGDQRERLITLTSKGKKLVIEMETKIQEHCILLFSNLTQQESLLLSTLLKKINIPKKHQL